MAVPIEEAIAALSTFSLEDDQAEVQGPGFWVSAEGGATISPIEYSDVAAYRLSLSEDTKAINQLNTLIQEGKEMGSVLYTYRSCVKALPQLPDSMKQSQADLYLETYQVLDLEMSRLREIQRWQASAASKLAADMQRFSRPERRINGPTVTHLWSMLKLLDVLIQLDHLKNAKASIPNDFSWYKRTFTQVSVQWQDTDSMREELDDLQIFLSTRWAILLNLHVEMFRVNNVEDILQILIVFIVESLELNFALLFPERHTLLRVLPVLVVLASSSEKDSESLYKRVKINRLINIFKNDPVIPAFPDLHLSPAAILKELSTYFPKFSAQTRALTLPAPHELQPREAQEYQRQYLIVNHIGAIRAEHDDFTVRFASAMSQLVLLKSIDGVDVEWVKEVKGNIYDMVVEGFQLLSRWTARVWEQCAWKFSRPCKDPVPIESQEMPASFSDYEKVVRYNYSAEERKALVELVSYIKSIGSMMQKVDTSVTDALWETIHAEVQDFVQNTVATMLRTTFRKKKDLSRILSDMRTLSADWMANTSKPETEMQSYQHSGEESRGTFFFPRPVAPTSAQVHCLQFLIYEVVSGGNMRKPGGIFGNSGSEIPINDLKQLETFFYKLGFFLHVLDYTATLGTLTDLGFLWFREFYLESSRVIQFPIECSLPWMLVDHVIESPIIGLLESALMPFDIYNDAAQQALVILKQRFLYDEIEAEVDNCFDIFVLKLCETIFTYYKSWAARELLDPSFLFAIDIGEKFAVQPMRFIALLKTTRVKLLGRTINLRSLIADRMNKMFRDNLEFLFDRFESQDLCAIVELEMLLDILQLTHELLSKDLIIDSFNLMLNEMQENVSLVSYSSRLASQIWTEMQNDFLPNFILCNTTQRFVRSSRVPPVPVQKPSVPYAKPNFYCGTPDLNSAYQSFARLYCGFFGVPHMFSLVKLVGSRSLPWLMRALLDHISNKITTVEPMITGLQQALPKSIGLLPFDGGISGCMRLVKEHLSCWHSKSELKAEVLCGIKEIGSILYWMGLLDIVLCNKIEKTELKEMMEETEQRTQKQSKEIKKKEERRRKRKKKNSNGGRPEEEESRRRRKEKKETYLVKKGSLMADDGRRRRCEPNPYFVAEEELEKKGSLLREVDTRHFMQTAPWLGLIPGADGQILHSQDGGDSPMVTLFKSATTATVSNHNCTNPTSFHTISRQAEAADLLYKANINTGSVLEYALAFTSAALDKYCSKWSAAPKTGFIDITTSKDFYRIFSGLQIEYLEESVQLQSNTYEMLGDSVAWGGCTIIYLLGQQLHFELFDFSHQVLNVAEVESVAISPTQKNPNFLQGIEGLLEAMKKARRLNNHVFSMLKARCPLEDKQACAIKQSGAPLHRVKFENTVSAFETLPQKGA
ncbi:protein PIR isoform X1 [Nicotiana sylvestris]|uniref:Protein PIR isoform X1 n=2 Tax=Nicotiana sylvestris TaxID=4096 RepID=A0A1U7V489_NICSY|nr:PREDICTED: protein PIR isoform X1 [Nicotiana sylvestris]